MSEQNQNTAGLAIPPEVQEQAKGLITQAFRFFAEQLRGMANEVAEFKKKQQEVRERIRRGARRSDGKLV